MHDLKIHFLLYNNLDSGIVRSLMSMTPFPSTATLWWCMIIINLRLSTLNFCFSIQLFLGKITDLSIHWTMLLRNFRHLKPASESGNVIGASEERVSMYKSSDATQTTSRVSGANLRMTNTNCCVWPWIILQMEIRLPSEILIQRNYIGWLKWVR